MAVWTRTGIAVAVLGLLLGMSRLSALAQPPGTQLVGTVHSVADDTVTLTDGTTFPITDQTRVTRIISATAAELKPGMFVAISAGRGSDGALLASLVAVFAPSVQPNEGQREMVETRFCEPGCQPRDLMTNALINDAVIDAVGLGELSISYAGTSEQVHLIDETRVEMQSVGSLVDIVPDANVLGFVNADGIGTGVWVYLD